MTTHEINEDVLTNIYETIELPEGLSMKFRKVQGPATGDEGREFVVSGPKADKVRKLIFAGLELTRKEIATLADCSVSRVGEVVWGLEYDGIEFPEIPLRASKPVVEDEAASV